MIDALTPVLNDEMRRFADDLERTGRRPAPRLRRPVVVALAALAIAVPAAVGGVTGVLPGDGDHAQAPPPPGYVVPRAVGTGVAVAAGQVSTGPWVAYAVACGGRAGVVIVLPDGTRTSGACGAVRPGVERAAPSFAPATLYDGASQTTWVYAATPLRVARIRLELSGGNRLDVTPQVLPPANQALRMEVGFVVVAVPGEQDVRAAEALDGTRHVITRCGSNAGCTDVGSG